MRRSFLLPCRTSARSSPSTTHALQCRHARSSNTSPIRTSFGAAQSTPTVRATAEALPLLDELLDHSTRPCFEYRHQWKLGDVVMWDNRCLLHKANGDYAVSEVRYLYRLMLMGEKPA